MSEEHRAHRLIVRGGLASAGGLGLRLGGRLVFLFVATQCFGAALIGAYSLAVAVVELAVAVGGLGMKRYLFKLLEDRGARPAGHVLLDAVLLVLPASLGLSAIIVAATLAVPVGTLGANTALALVCAAPMVAGQAMLDLCLATTRWRQKMRYEVVARSVIEPYVGAAAMVGAYLAGLTASGMLVGYAAGTLGALGYAALGARRCLGGLKLRTYRSDPAALRQTVRASVLPTLTDGVSALFTRADLYLVGAMLGESAAGIYAIARQLKMPVRQVRQSFDSLLTPIVAKTLSTDGAATTGTAIATAARLILVLQLGICIGFVAIGEPLLAWFGAEFTPAYVALLLLAAAELIQGSYSVNDLVLLYLRGQWALAVTCVITVVYFVTAPVLIAYFGLDGAALAMVLAILAGAWLRRTVMVRKFAIRIPLAQGIGPWTCAAVAVVPAVLWHTLVPIDAPPIYHLGALAAVLAIYATAIWLWQRTSGESLRLMGFRAA